MYHHSKYHISFPQGVADVSTEDMPPLEADDDDDADQQKMEEVD